MVQLHETNLETTLAVVINKNIVTDYGRFERKIWVNRPKLSALMS